MRWIAAALVIAGCSRENATTATEDTDTTVLSNCAGIDLEIGTSETSYVSRQTKGDVVVARGPQQVWSIDAWTAACSGTEAPPVVSGRDRTCQEETMRWIAAALVIAGCSGEQDSTETGDSTTTGSTCAGIDLEIGTGATAYAPLQTGGDVLLVHGPQGGWHIDTAAVLTGASSDVSGTPTITLTDTQQPLSILPTPALVALSSYDSDSCSGQLIGLRAFVDNFPAEVPDAGQQAFLCQQAGASVDVCIQVANIVTQESATKCVMGTLVMDPSNECDTL